jgi:hypothetical protein
MIQKINMRQAYMAKIYDDSGRPIITIKESSAANLKKKINSIFEKLL